MKPTRQKASEKERALKAVYKLIETGWKKKMKLKARKLHKAGNNNNVF